MATLQPPSRVLPGEVCGSLTTEAHSRKRAGVGQAEGLEWQSEAGLNCQGQTGMLSDALLGNMPRTPLCFCCSQAVESGSPDADPSSATVLAETSEGTPLGHKAAKQSAGKTNAARLRQSLPCLVCFLCSNQAQKSFHLPEGCRAPPPRTTGIFQAACSPSNLPSHGPLLQGPLCPWPGQQDSVTLTDNL